MAPGKDRSTPPFSLSIEERERLRTDIDLDAFERLLAVLPPQARRLLLELAAKRPDLVAIWEQAPALRRSERAAESEAGYREPHVTPHSVPRLEEVTLSSDVLQRMLEEVFRGGR